MSQFSILKSYLEDNGVTINKSTETHYFQPTQTINIHHRYNMEKNGLYTLLHEAGHWLQHIDANYIQNLKEQFHKNIDDDFKISMLMFIHELNAWDRGKQLAEDLGLVIDKKLFEINKQEALLTYYGTQVISES